MSLWVAEARLAIIQHFHGLEAQKRFKNTLKEQARGGIIGYILHNFGARNEPSVTTARFDEQIIARISKLNIDEPKKAYLRFKITREMPNTLEEMADLLRIEQTHSPIDAYETFIAVLQHAIGRGVNPDLSKSFIQVIDKLKDVDDFRLDKACAALGIVRREMVVSELTDLNQHLLLDGKLSVACQNAVSTIRAGNATIGDLHVAGLVLSLGAKRTPSDPNKIITQILNQLVAIFSVNSDFDSAHAALTKLSTNFFCLPFCKALRSFCIWGERADLNGQNYHRKLSRLNDRAYTAEDLLLVTGDARIKLDDLLQKRIPHSLAVKFFKILESGYTTVDLTNEFFKFAAARYELKINAPLQAISILESLSQTVTQMAFQVSITRSLIEAYAANDEPEKAFALIAAVTARNDQFRHLLRIGTIADPVAWPRLKTFSDDVSVPVTLHLRLREGDYPKTGTYLRASVKVFLDTRGVQMPSELDPTTLDSDQLIYFLHRVCVPSVIDLLPGLANSRAPEAERIKICEMLKELDPENEDTYEIEIRNLAKKRRLEDGLRIVDETRLYVDEEAIGRWAGRELTETYRRYFDLVNAGVGVAGNLADIFKMIATRADISELTTPNSEADYLFISMLDDLRDQFLLGQEDGLNAYLSRRVRHNTMHDLIRAPVKAAHLITQKETASSRYAADTFWITQLASLTDNQHQAVIRHLKIFSEEFDAIIIKLKDDVLQVKTPEHPHGVFEIPIEAAIIQVLSGFAQGTKPSLDEFIKLVMRFYWGLITPSLKIARDKVAIDTKSSISAAFDRLHKGLSENAREDIMFYLLAQKIGDTKIAVNAELEKVANWFQQRDSSTNGKMPLDEIVQVAATSAFLTHAPDTPDITVAFKNGENTPFSIALLPIVTDILTIAIDNAVKYAGLPTPLTIHLDIDYDSNKNLIFHVTNGVAPHLVKSGAMRKLEGIRKQIKDGDYREKLGREGGGTGLKRIAAVVSNLGGSLDFQLSSSSFELKAMFAIQSFSPEATC